MLAGRHWIHGSEIYVSWTILFNKMRGWDGGSGEEEGDQSIDAAKYLKSFRPYSDLLAGPESRNKFCWGSTDNMLVSQEDNLMFSDECVRFNYLSRLLKKFYSFVVERKVT